MALETVRIVAAQSVGARRAARHGTEGFDPCRGELLAVPMDTVSRQVLVRASVEDVKAVAQLLGQKVVNVVLVAVEDGIHTLAELVPQHTGRRRYRGRSRGRNCRLDRLRRHDSLYGCGWRQCSLRSRSVVSHRGGWRRDAEGHLALDGGQLLAPEDGMKGGDSKLIPHLGDFLGKGGSLEKSDPSTDPLILGARPQHASIAAVGSASKEDLPAVKVVERLLEDG